MTSQELAEQFMFHEMNKPSKRRMSVQQAKLMIDSFANDYHQEQLRIFVVGQAKPEKVCDNCQWELIYNNWYRCDLCDDVKFKPNL